MPTLMPLPDHAIGGAYIRRRFDMGTRTVYPGETLTREQVLAIPTANRRALINTGRLEVYPIAPMAAGTKRFAIHMGMGKFDVIEGTKLNNAPLTRAEAEAMLPPEDRPGRRPKAKPKT